MISISNDELDSLPILEDQYIKCLHCSNKHIIEYGNTIDSDGVKIPSKTLGFYKCGDKVYLATIDGRLLG